MKSKRIVATLLLAAFTSAAASAGTPTTAPAAAPASNADEVVRYANNKYLAYINSTNAGTNDTSQAGLEALSATLIKSTLIKPAGVVGLNPDDDKLPLFRFIYWPVEANASPLSEKARSNIKHYLDNRGVILFDVQDDAGNPLNSKALHDILGDQLIQSLVKMNKDYVLNRTFFLMKSLPGTNDYTNIFIEAAGNKGTENVSPVIVGDNNWAAAWAGNTLLPNSPEREMALRSGVNFVMFAFTGNYKTDQTQTPGILDRLGKDSGP